MRLRLMKWYQALLSALLTLLGFESCDKVADQPDEYGAPYSTFHVVGTVTEAESQQPVEGIQVKVGIESEQGRMYAYDSTLSDASGHYEMTTDGLFLKERQVLVAVDVDGAGGGGRLKSDTLTVSKLPTVQTREASGWFQGEFEVTGNFELKRE